MQTLFILRERDEPLSVGDVIIAQGFQRYRIVVKRIIDTKTMKDGRAQWTIRGTREVLPDEE